MTRQPDTLSFWRGALPHWEVVDGRYFVTVRLAGSLPAGRAEELAAILAEADRANYLAKSREYFRRLDAWLDADRSVVYLGEPAVVAVIVDTIRKYEEFGYWRVFAYCVLPNHLHLFFDCGTVAMSDCLRRFTRYTARAANALLGRAGARFWQREWFDHWSRSAQEDDKVVAYIRNNPVRAGLAKRVEDWPWVR